MFLRYSRLYPLCFLCLSLCVIAHLSLNTYAVVTAQAEPAFVRRVRNLETAPLGILNPAGLVFSPKGRNFQVIASRQASATATDLVQLTPVERVSGSRRLAAKIDDPINVAFDGKRNRLLVLRKNANQLLIIQADDTGTLDPQSLRNGKLRALGLQNPQGITVDPATGILYILDAVGPRLLQLTPDANGNFETAGATIIDLSGAGLVNPRGLAWHPDTGHLYLASPTSQLLVELTTTGQVVATRDLSSFGLSNPQALVFAPTGDLTDDPAALSLYIADAGQPTAAQSTDDPSLTEAGCLTTEACPNTLYLPLVIGGETQSVATAEESVASAVPANAGAIVELSLAAPRAAAASNFATALVRTVDLAALTPAIPDPSGLTYVASRNTLLLSDGEVDETVAGITHFQGANVWELGLNGAVVRTANISKVTPSIVRMTNEPTGTTWNPNNGHYYISDDDARRIYDLNPGADGLIGTADDTWTFFDTLAVGNSDPEGLTFDPVNNQIIVADGLNIEIYRYSTSGAFLGQFDVAQYGVLDPESVEYNPGSGTLFILSNHTSRIIVETTLTGTLLNTFDISAAAAYTPAGLAYAPASDGSGLKRFYVVDRRIDNDVDPNIVDGKLYELTAPQPAANAAPIVNAGLDQTITFPNAAILDATVTDDGLPSPPTLTTTWSQVSGPGTVTFGNAAAIDTTVAFSAVGVYTLRLTASDGALSSSDDIIINVTTSTAVNTPPFVNAGVDQTITLPSAAILDATVTDDGLPSPPTLTTNWSQLSGPGTVIFGNANAIDTTAAFSAAGVYTLRLIASDSALSVSDDVILTVNTSTAVNTPPVVNAGPDLAVALPNLATIDATVTDDGRPSPPTLTTSWSKLSGPGTVTFGNANAIDTTAAFSAAGVYTLRLTASDGALSGSDDVIITATSDVIFADGFETGTLAAWSASSNGGSLSVTTAAALAGSSRGLRVALTSNTATYLTDLTPASETRYRARFYFDPNTITMSGGNAHYIFYGDSGTSTVAVYIEFRRSSGQYQLRAGILNDASSYSVTTWNTITDAPHSMEIDWRRSSAAGANNGGLTFWIDGVQRANLTGIDNDTRRIDGIRLGPVSGIDSGTRGAYYFDAFVSSRQNYIGP